jgi:tetratricopeptide (TPR) repeat protein
MISVAPAKSWNETYSRLFNGYFRQLQSEVALLRKQKIGSIRKRLEHLYDTWAGAYGNAGDITKSEIVAFGLALGRLAESYSFHQVAESVLNSLADDAINRFAGIEFPAEILISAGELNRRRGELSNAESRFQQAASILEEDLSAEAKRTRSNKELGRVYYEFAYLARLRGDAGAARSALERSEVECELSADWVGVQIAKSLKAAILYEEGFAEDAVWAYEKCLVEFQKMVSDPELEKSGRSGFARRWLVNTQIHLGQANLSAGNVGAARKLIEERLAAADTEPSTIGFSTAKRIEAQLRLAEGDLDRARDAIEKSWNTIREQGEEITTELAAATITIAGVIHALKGGNDYAQSCFEQACRLNPDLHNHRAQGWACAGRAILASASKDENSSRLAIFEGLKLVERCGAPIRFVLLELLRSRYSKKRLDLKDLRELVHKFG